MKPDKDFDSVKIKDEVQARILKEQQGMSDKEIRAAVQKKLQSSNSPVAKLWRKLQKKDAEKAA